MGDVKDDDRSVSDIRNRFEVSRKSNLARPRTVRTGNKIAVDRQTIGLTIGVRCLSVCESIYERTALRKKPSFPELEKSFDFKAFKRTFFAGIDPILSLSVD